MLAFFSLGCRCMFIYVRCAQTTLKSQLTETLLFLVIWLNLRRGKPHRSVQGKKSWITELRRGRAGKVMQYSLGDADLFWKFHGWEGGGPFFYTNYLALSHALTGTLFLVFKLIHFYI